MAVRTRIRHARLLSVSLLMTHFEYIAVAISIILGLGIIQLLSNLDQVMARSRRYWLHSLWVFFIFWIVVQNWWAFWDMRDVTWNLGYFSIWITFVSLIYLLTVALTKTESLEASWKTVYFSRTHRFFGLFGFAVILAVLNTWIVLDAPLLHPYRFVQYSALIIIAFLFASKRERLHEVLSVLLIAIIVLGQILFRFQPGLFGAA